MCDVDALLNPLPKRSEKKLSWTPPLPHLAWHLKLIWPFIYWQILHLEKFLRTNFPGLPAYVYRVTDFGRVVLVRHAAEALSPFKRDTALRAPEPAAPETASTLLNLDTMDAPWTEDCVARAVGLITRIMRVRAPLPYVCTRRPLDSS